MNETKKDIPAWEQFLEDCDQKEKQNAPNWELVPDMDTQEIAEKVEALEFFKNRDLDPKARLALSDAIDELPFVQGSVLRAIFWKGMTTAEVAKDLKTTTKAVRMVKSRALKELKRNLTLKKTAVTFGVSENSTISEG